MSDGTQRVESMHSVLLNDKPVTPSKIVCVGRNYVAHIEELGNEMPGQMVVFNKPNSAITDILRSQIAGETLHYEAELAFLIGAGRLAAVGFGLDLTKRELQTTLKQQGLPWERAKAFDGSALFSDFVDLPRDIDSLSLRLEVDGMPRQAGDVPLMIHKPDAILRELAQFTSLEDGDIVMTGTPEGVGEIHTGERFEARILAGTRTLLTASWVAQ
jgi:2-keto-4-pentenoate hydratase/2-oxohepta-3-ene-1,7-dioic acid hydratase in catechol pathway